MNSWSKNLELLIKSRTSIIWIKTKEEERLEKILNFSCERLNIKRYICWVMEEQNIIVKNVVLTMVIYLVMDLSLLAKDIVIMDFV